MKENRRLILGLVAAVLLFALSLWLAASAGWLSGATSVMWGAMKAGYEVVADGLPVGVVDRREPVERAVRAAADALGAEPNVVFTPVRAPANAFADAEEVAARLASTARAGVEAAVILISGRPACAVSSLEEGWLAVEEALRPWSEHALLESAEPLGRVRVVTATVDENRVLTVAQAAAALILGDAAGRTSTARAGERPAAFAARHGLTTGELKRANPGLIGAGDLKAGTAYIVTKPRGLLHVLCRARGTAPAPAETVYRPDPALYVLQTRVVDEGAQGGTVPALETWVDGVRVASVPEEEPARARVVAYGTRPLPASGEAVPTDASGVLWPVRGTVTSRFGWRWGRMHRGVDIAAALGTPVVAARAGTVTYAGWRGDYGQLVEVDHGGGLVTRYGHCYGLLVSPGEAVAAGSTLALLGSTGRSTGPHVHFEVRVDGQAVDPMGRLG